MHRPDMRFDVRTQPHRLLRKEISREELDTFLDGLPDDAAEAVETSTRFVASASTPTQDGDDSEDD